MVRVESPPIDRGSSVARAVFLPVLLMGGATAAAAALVSTAARIPVVWCGAVATVVVAALSVQLTRRARDLRAQRAVYERRFADLERRIATHDDETVRISKELLAGRHPPAARGQFARRGAP